MHLVPGPLVWRDAQAGCHPPVPAAQCPGAVHGVACCAVDSGGGLTALWTGPGLAVPISGTQNQVQAHMVLKGF